MGRSHLVATFHWLESQLLCDPGTNQDLDPELGLSLKHLMKIKHNRGREGGGGGGGGGDEY